MKRVFWLAAGPLLVLAVGAWLIWVLPEEEVENAKRGYGDEMVLPSGLAAEFHEMLWDRPGQGLVYRFRFVAPAFDPGGDVEVLMADLEHLCTNYALPRLAENTGPQPNQLIISLADKPSEFGVYNPDVVQVFEAFSVENGACIWEMF